jgi:clan AA aspartic protease (TIGR02281 family)
VLAAALLAAAPAMAQAGGWATAPARGVVTLERSPLGVLIVAAKLNGRVEGRFLLDTGATWCAVTPRTAARLGLSQVGEQIQVQTGGGLVPMPVVRIAVIEIGGRRARGVQATIASADLGGLDGVIGMNFLNQFVYAIDPRHRVLRLD